ncbi:hypothetical protein [Rhodococcus kronopolitis]|uniref:Integral membrane protein n=1 Tax=Rhodococcus kronopolitis TaxID=1460226 RepID=A0ABV9FRE5_9NOCA
MTDPGGPPRARERVVLATRRGARVVRTRVEVQEQTEVGEVMVRALVRAQLGLAVRIAVLVAAVLGLIPLLVMVLPALTTASVFGVRLPWLVLGAAVYPMLYGAGWLYRRLAEHTEQEFVDLADD